MYEAPAFGVDDADAILVDLATHHAATLVTSGPDGLASTILPVLLRTGDDGRRSIVGHVARGNAAALAGDGHPALVLLTGAAGYVTPSWYASKAEHGKVVPTWDYVAVEAVGTLRLHPDAEWLRALVTQLTDRHEGARAEPWAVSDAPSSFVDAMLKGIVGVELVIDRMAAKAKLSQNRSEADVAGVVAGLRADGAHDLADAVDHPPT